MLSPWSKSTVTSARPPWCCWNWASLWPASGGCSSRSSEARVSRDLCCCSSSARRCSCGCGCGCKCGWPCRSGSRLLPPSRPSAAVAPSAGFDKADGLQDGGSNGSIGWSPAMAKAFNQEKTSSSSLTTNPRCREIVLEIASPVITQNPCYDIQTKTQKQRCIPNDCLDLNFWFEAVNVICSCKPDAIVDWNKSTQ